MHLLKNDLYIPQRSLGEANNKLFSFQFCSAYRQIVSQIFYQIKTRSFYKLNKTNKRIRY